MDFTQREKEAAHDKAQMRRIRAFAVSAFAGDKLPKRNDMLPNTKGNVNSFITSRNHSITRLIFTRAGKD